MCLFVLSTQSARFSLQYTKLWDCVCVCVCFSVVVNPLFCTYISYKVLFNLIIVWETDWTFLGFFPFSYVQRKQCRLWIHLTSRYFSFIRTAQYILFSLPLFSLWYFSRNLPINPKPSASFPLSIRKDASSNYVCHLALSHRSRAHHPHTFINPNVYVILAQVANSNQK